MYFSDRKIRLEGAETTKDFFVINNVTYEALPLDLGNSEIGLGINSSVFTARRSDDGQDFAVKICSFWERRNPHPRAVRFTREIEALRRCRENDLNGYVVEAFDAGIVQIANGDRSSSHQAYILEKADGTLSDFLKNQ